MHSSSIDDYVIDKHLQNPTLFLCKTEFKIGI